VGINQRKEHKQKIIDALWLHYFNNTLFEKGLISERSFTKMKLQIVLRELRDCFREDTCGLPYSQGIVVREEGGW
jgi:hypothetical protein